MTNSREILGRINSIKDTMKITNAMYMISSAKVKKARASLEKTEPFFNALESMVGRMLKDLESETDIKNKYFDTRKDIPKEDRVEGYLLITADKGLASSYNHNVIKTVEEKIQGDDSCLLFVVGEVGRRYFQKRNVKIDEMFKYTAQNPTVNRAREIAETLLEYFIDKKVDEVHVVYTYMGEHNIEEVVSEKILPLEIPKGDNKSRQNVTFYPDARTVINTVVPTCVSGFIYGALVEAFCAENNSRMMAMSSATDAAKDMIKSLQLDYNRARQSAITQEITEVVSGANAQKSSNNS
ncbi:MAG: ATP synthase F1 subunit gamma [Oscillospiraceae bacterium]|nr:ATP synthase F1 subunit gamma [Candidatus Ruminococcus equi]